MEMKNRLMKFQKMMPGEVVVRDRDKMTTVQCVFWGLEGEWGRSICRGAMLW